MLSFPSASRMRLALPALAVTAALASCTTYREPFAIAIISGLVVQLPLVLFFMPTVYVWLHGFGTVRRTARMSWAATA